MSNHLNAIFQSLNTALVVFDEALQCIYVNEAFEALLNKSRKHLLGAKLDDIFLFNTEVQEQSKAVLRGEYPSFVIRELELHLPYWQRSLLIDIDISTAVIEDKTNLVFELHDRKLIKKLRQYDDSIGKFNVASQLVRGLCHEIKNPLGGIRGAAQLLDLEVQDEEIKEYTQVIMREVDRLDELLNRMTNDSQSADSHALNIHDELTHISKLLLAEHQEELHFEYDFDTSLPSLMVNPSQVSQVLLNLLKNAAQWSLLSPENEADAKQSAQISIKTRFAFPDLTRSLMPQCGVQIQITDNGPGVDQQVKDQLFFPMVSARRGGTGLGLSISQEIAQAHGGFIELESVNTAFDSSLKGACFSFYLPFDKDHSLKAEAN